MEAYVEIAFRILLTTGFGIIISLLSKMNSRQRREQIYQKCYLKAVDYALEQALNGDYIKVRDAKMKQLLNDCKFKDAV